jgi:hypothetical protein
LPHLRHPRHHSPDTTSYYIPTRHDLLWYYALCCCAEIQVISTHPTIHTIPTAPLVPDLRQHPHSPSFLPQLHLGYPTTSTRLSVRPTTHPTLLRIIILTAPL